MKIVIAPNAFKGTMTAGEAAEAMAKGIRKVLNNAEIIVAPVSDGGDGSLDTLIDILNGERCSSIVNGPLGEPVEAEWGIINNGNTVFIETARAFGLTLVPFHRRDPGITTSKGIGDIINSGLDLGIRDFIVAVGGSANNDGGTGMMKALGVRFLDKNGNNLKEGGLDLKRLNKIDISKMDPRVEESKFMVLSDSTVPLTGSTGVSIMYSPGKGASIETAYELDKALVNYADVIFKQFKLDVKTAPCGGSGGGIVCAAQVFWSNVALALGIDYVLKKIKFNAIITGADLVITGEGCIDEQTIYNKAPIGVARWAKRNSIPVLGICALVGSGYKEVYNNGMDGLVVISGKKGWVKENTIVTDKMITDATVDVFKQLKNIINRENMGFPIKKRYYRE